MTKAEAQKIVKRTRNAEKKRYAEAYLLFKLGRGPEPDTSAYSLSFMGTQAVRLEFAELA